MSYQPRHRSVTNSLARVLLAAMVALLLAGSLGPLAVGVSAQEVVPELTAPTDAAVVEGLPLFEWTVPSGETAWLEVATDRDFAQLVAAVETTEPSHQQVQELDRTVAYWWRVGLIGEDGEKSWSATRAFTLSAPPVVEPTPEPTVEPTEIPATDVPVATDVPTDIPAETAIAPEPTIAPTEAATEALGTASVETATPTASTQRVSAQAVAIPPSKTTGTLPPSEGFALVGASRSNGSTTSTSVVDRDLTTMWTSAINSPSSGQVTVGMDRSRTIGEIRWMWGLRYRADRVRIEVSRDRESWSRVATIENAPTGDWQSLKVDVYTKYIRFTFENPNRDTWVGGLAEVEVHAGASVVNPPPTATPQLTSAAIPQADGIVTNASFEQPGAPNWHVEQGAGVVKASAHGGVHSMRLLPTGGYAGQGVTLARGATYELSGWGKLGTGNDVGQIGINFYDSAGARLRSLEPRMLPFTTTTYSAASIRFAYPAQAVSASVVIYKEAGTARFYVDDLAIRVVSAGVVGTPTPTPTPTATPQPTTAPKPQADGIVTNASFEQPGAPNWHVEQGAGVVKASAHGGVNSMRLLPTGGYAGQGVKLEYSKIYELSGWGKLGTGNDVGQIGINFYDSAGARLRSLEPRMLPFTTTTYSAASVRFAYPSRAVSASVVIYKEAGTARFYVDDLAIRVVSGGVDPSPPRVTCQQLSIPGYFDPSTGLWDTTINTATGLGIAVFNIESGPGATYSAAYAQKITAARNAGITPYGYVTSSYGARTLARVKADVDLWAQRYGVTSIFLDESATSLEMVPLYRSYMAYIHQGGGKVMANFGWTPHVSYMEFTDIANIFEDSGSVYENNYNRPSWIQTFPASRFGHIIFNTPASRMDEVLALSKERNAGYVWISDDNGVPLFKVLPTYWTAINNAVRVGC